MSKTKIEELSELNNVTVEIVIEKGISSVLIYKDNDIYIRSFNERLLYDAIENAANHFMQKIKSK